MEIEGVDASANAGDAGGENAGVVETPETSTAPTNEGTGSTPGINPAWNELLGNMPSSLHSQIIPHLQKWDQSVESRLATVQSQYAPYKSLVEQKINPDEAVAALRLAQMIAENPKEFYDRMGQHYGSEWGLNSGQGQAPNDADDYSLEGLEDEDNPFGNLEQNPLIKQLQEQQAIIAQFLAGDVQRREAAQQAQVNEQADLEVKQEIEAITAKYGTDGKLDQRFINAALSMAVQNNQTIEEAAEVIAGLAGMNQRPPAPTVVSPSGGIPADITNVANLDSKSTKALAMQMLRAASGN